MGVYQMRFNVTIQRYIYPLIIMLCCNAWGFVQAGDVFKGAEIYATYCQQCHGADGRGVLPNAPDFTRGDGLMRTDIEVFNTIRAGKGSGHGRAGACWRPP